MLSEVSGCSSLKICSATFDLKWCGGAFVETLLALVTSAKCSLKRIPRLRLVCPMFVQGINRVFGRP